MQRNRWLYLSILVAIVLVLLAAAASAGAQRPAEGPGPAARSAGQAATIWRDVSERQIRPTGARLIIPAQYRTVAADLAALDALLVTAPQEQAVPVRAATTIIALPLPDGTLGRFRFVNSPIMEAPLAAKFPEITTYLGQGIDDPAATVRFDRTPAGFHAMILAPGNTVFIDPYSQGDSTHYISYFKHDFHSAVNKMFREEGVDLTTAPPAPAPAPHTPSGPQLRTYRAAVAATGEYTIFHGGTVGQGLAAIVTSMNRVGGAYEVEVAVRMVLVANNNLIVYTDPNTDPYTNNNGGQMLGQNQTNLDAVIGNANYDIGHVFSTGGGGVASLGVPCRTGVKARGVTGSSAPIGDPFDIDYVAHEIGHQFGANHTFNGTTGSCGGGNRSGGAAYEPGSGSTIMAYAGICGAENLQPNSDAYFHSKSFDEIITYTTVGQGNSCPVITNTGNNAPIVNAGSSYTIPQNTYFKLTGSATDPNGDPLTYNWEQYNLGAAAPPNTDDGTRPIFRSFNAVPVPYRFFPRLSDILNNTLTFGEAMQMTNRTLTFRLTARDNRAGGGGVDYATVNIPATTSSGPFLVTAPNTAVTWPGGSQQSVTWDVANTTAPPVSCPNVNILLSTDGGNNFLTTLVGGTANDGSETVNVPNVSTTQARVQVECATNIFFDLSNVNFTIQGGPTPTGTQAATPTSPPATSTPCPGSSQTFQGSIDLSDPAHADYVDLGSGPSSCGTPPTCPGLAGDTDSYHYSTHSIANTTGSALCLTITIDATGCGAGSDGLWALAYLNSFDPNNLCMNYIGDAGDAAILSTETFGVTVPAGATLIIEVEEYLADAGCTSYTVTVDGLPGACVSPTVTPPVAATATATACPIQFTDVPASNPFYAFIRCLACRGILSGYSDGTFRWGADVTRGQLAKIIAGAAGLGASIPSSRQTFSDVPNTNAFWLFIERLAGIGAISGYACGGPGEPCDPSSRPYFRWGANATRGQIAKITGVTAGWNGPIPTTQQTFTDVPPTNPFWTWIEELASRSIISGYTCGGPGEPCDPSNRPYFRWGANATRGQMSKIAASAFYPNCQTPAKR